MYAFFRVEGQADSLAFAKRLVERRTAWAWRPAWPSAPEGEGWLRWCFASRDPERLDAGRGSGWLGACGYNRWSFARAVAPEGRTAARYGSVSPVIRKWQRKPSSALE